LLLELLEREELLWLIDTASNVFFTLIVFQDTVTHLRLALSSQLLRIRFFTCRGVSPGFKVLIRDANHATYGVAIEVQSQKS
jgi:hypothetical protein